MKTFQLYDNSHHIPLEVSEEKRANLLTLANYLAGLKPDYEHFNMRHYFLASGSGDEERQLVKAANLDISTSDANYKFYGEDDPRFTYAIQPPNNSFEERIGKCGAVACAIGHGPLAGIKEDPEIDLSWSDYAWRVFGFSDGGHGAFMFGADWQLADPTPMGAANRIYYALQHGIPTYFHCERYSITDHLREGATA